MNRRQNLSLPRAVIPSSPIPLRKYTYMYIYIYLYHETGLLLVPVFALLFSTSTNSKYFAPRSSLPSVLYFCSPLGLNTHLMQSALPPLHPPYNSTTPHFLSLLSFSMSYGAEVRSRCFHSLLLSTMGSFGEHGEPLPPPPPDTHRHTYTHTHTLYFIVAAAFCATTASFVIDRAFTVVVCGAFATRVFVVETS